MTLNFEVEMPLKNFMNASKLPQTLTKDIFFEIRTLRRNAGSSLEHKTYKAILLNQNFVKLFTVFN